MEPPVPLERILADLPRFESLEVVVVGDYFVDEYVEGEMFEISKEGPIPVVRFESRRRAAGAAGNLASSIRGLGARVRAVGTVGDDPNGASLTAELESKGIDTAALLVQSDSPTWTYTKIRARVESAPSREILRLDVLPRGPAPAALEARTIDALRRAAEGADAIVVLDQIAHLITPRILAELPRVARTHGALLHGSSRDRTGELRDFDLVIPNDQEAAGALGVPPGETDPLELGRRLVERGGHRQALVTLGPEGMAVIPARGEPSRIPSAAGPVVDVTGAGDAVASAAVLGNALGWDLRTVAWTASHAAALAIARTGTHHVARAELEARLRAGR